MAKNKAVFQILVTYVLFWFFQFRRKSKTDLHGLLMWILWLCRIVNYLKLNFCSYKHFFQRFTSFVGYDRRHFLNLFSAEADFLLDSSLCHQRLFKILYRWVMCCNERQ